MPTVARGVYPGMSDNMREKVTRTLRELGLEPKGRAQTY
jgi:hypothetical protein